MINIIKYIINGGINMKSFNKEKLNIETLKPQAKDIELNKCTHIMYDEDTKICEDCGVNLNLELSEDELITMANNLITYLETLKMVINLCGSKKEIRAMQKYFNMIPLLKNIKNVHYVCEESHNEYLNFIEVLAYMEEQDDQIEENNEDTKNDENSEGIFKSLSLDN